LIPLNWFRISSYAYGVYATFMYWLLGRRRKKKKRGRDAVE
jgi:hypothetical protein